MFKVIGSHPIFGTVMSIVQAETELEASMSYRRSHPQFGVSAVYSLLKK